MKTHLVILLTFALAAGSVAAEPTTAANTNLLLVATSTNASWWAGVINHGDRMPLANGYEADLCGDTYGNQAQPLLLSSQGDVIWSEDAFAVQLSPRGLAVDGKGGRLIQTKSGESLRDAFLYASRTHFPPSGKLGYGGCLGNHFQGIGHESHRHSTAGSQPRNPPVVD